MEEEEESMMSEQENGKGLYTLPLLTRQDSPAGKGDERVRCYRSPIPTTVKRANNAEIKKIQSKREKIGQIDEVYSVHRRR